MRYPAIKPGLKDEEAIELLRDLRAGKEVDEGNYVAMKGSGEDVRGILPDIERELENIRRRYPTKLRERDPEGGKFEVEACVVFHKSLRPRDPIMLADQGWWKWLSIFRFRTLIDWRYGGEAKPENFGISKSKENFMYRLWLRAEIGYDERNHREPYELARCGDQDFWRSHIMRQEYGKCRNFARALVRYQYPEGPNGEPRLPQHELRELVKRLRRLRPSFFFEFLDEVHAYKLIEEEAERTGAKAHMEAGR